MEPFTAVALVAGRHGVGMLASALSGRSDIGELAGEIFAALSASENRLDTRLAAIGKQLGILGQQVDELLDQRFVAGIAGGLRRLLEAAEARDVPSKQQELGKARDHFLNSHSAARSSLQRAIANRYVVLTALIAERPDHARTANKQLSAAVVTTVLEVNDAITAAAARTMPETPSAAAENERD